jgi:hypothetical protein
LLHGFGDATSKSSDFFAFEQSCGTFKGYFGIVFEVDAAQVCMSDEVCRQPEVCKLLRPLLHVGVNGTYRRNGKPNPSLAPASDEMISRKARGTYLSEKGPLATACERIGSVQVTQEPITRAARNESLGMVMRMHKLVQIHMMVLVGQQ